MRINASTDFSSLSFDDEIEFEPMNFRDLVITLNGVLTQEESLFDVKNLQGQTFKLNLKSLSTEDLIYVYEHAMTRDTLVNARLILNLQILINGYSTFDDSLFASPEIFLSRIEQVLDIKLALAEQLKEFQTNIAHWFLACLKSMHKVEYTSLDPITPLPALYKRILFSTNLLNLSSIIQKANNIQTKDLPLVEDAFPVVMELATSSALANNMIQSFDFEAFMK